MQCILFVRQILGKLNVLAMHGLISILIVVRLMRSCTVLALGEFYLLCALRELLRFVIYPHIKKKINLILMWFYISVNYSESTCTNIPQRPVTTCKKIKHHVVDNVITVKHKES